MHWTNHHHSKGDDDGGHHYPTSGIGDPFRHRSDDESGECADHHRSESDDGGGDS